jgi:predicted secreted protein
MAGVNAFGTQLLRGDGASPEVFTAIANVVSIEGPEVERETLDMTAHDTPDGWREFVGGLKDGGEVSVEVNYDPALHDDLIDDFDDPAPRNWKIVFPTSPSVEWEFAAVLTGFSSQAPHDDKLSAEITLKVSGKPVIS